MLKNDLAFNEKQPQLPRPIQDGTPNIVAEIAALFQTIMHLKIEKRSPILKKEKGQYHSFPTLVRQENQLWMACRSGSVSGRQAHGVDGKVLIVFGGCGQTGSVDVSWIVI